MKTNITIKQINSSLFTIKEKYKSISYYYEVIATTKEEALDLFEKTSHKVSLVGTLHFNIDF